MPIASAFKENMKRAESNNQKRRGLLIAFEGIDGTGKSTQLQLLAAALAARGYDVLATREPTTGPFGLQIRELFVNRAAVSPAEELELFIADRRQHVAEVIEPALQAGKIVLTDRYYLSTAAYQGAAGFDPVEIIRRNETFAPQPDLAILLVVPPAIGTHRILALRGEKLNAFEQENSLRRVAAVFDRLETGYLQRVDGAGPREKVQLAIRGLVDELLAKQGRAS